MGSGEKLTRVTSEKQLRPGLLVEARGCWCSEGTHRVLLVRSEASSGCEWCEEECVAWYEAPSLHGDSRPFCVAEKIKEGELYIVDPFSSQETDTARPRKLEGAR